MKHPYVETKNGKELCKLLGLPETLAPRLKLRAQLVQSICSALETQGLTHVQAAQKAGIGRTIITAIANGNIAKISTDRLLDLAHALGCRYSLKVG